MIRKALAAEVELGDGPGRRRRRRRGSNGHRDRGRQVNVRTDGGERFRARRSPRSICRDSPCANASMEDRGERQQQHHQAMYEDRHRGSARSANRPSCWLRAHTGDRRRSHPAPGSRAQSGCSTTGAPSDRPLLKRVAASHPALQQVDRQQASRTKRRACITTAMRGQAPGRSRTARQLADDDQRCDLRHVAARLPAMKTTDPYSPTARAKASVKPVSSAGMMRRQDHLDDQDLEGASRRASRDGLVQSRAPSPRGPAGRSARRTAGR